jgi:hypothetical protein
VFASVILERVVSIDPPRRLRSAVPPQRGPVDLVKHAAPTAVSLIKRTEAASRVSLVKRVSLLKAGHPTEPRPSPAHLRQRRPRRSLAATATLTMTAVRHAPGRGVRATRAWARRPGGRVAVPGLLMAVLVVLATATGVLLPRATGARSPASQAEQQDAAQENAPDEGAQEPGGGLPFPGGGSAGPGADGQRPADVLTGWAAPMAVKTGIPVVALQAYAYAELVVAQTHATCNLRWTTVAGIGRHESNHGRSSGATLSNEGRATPLIFGPPLNGQNNTKAIPDTDSGRLDGDRTWDRAIGPMQFIPTTWARYAVDADHDGVADPHDIDDAALATATYLCAGGRNLSTSEGWWAAILTYNNVQIYAQDVFNAANAYGISSRS